MNYQCEYETRKRNAHGSFGTTTVNVEANDVGNAMKQAFNQLQEQNLETRNPVRCNDLTGKELMKAMAPEFWVEQPKSVWHCPLNEYP